MIMSIYLFLANFAWLWTSVSSPAPAPYVHIMTEIQVNCVYTNEIIPTRLRAKACTLRQLANWTVNFVVAFTIPSFLRSSLSGLYFLYGTMTLVATVVCIFVPETKGCGLEKIEQLSKRGKGDIGERNGAAKHL